jgi:hypothetical protein
LEDAAFRRLLARLALLRAYARHRDEHGLSDLGAQEVIAEQYARQEVAVDAWVYAVYPTISARTLRRWEERMVEGGLVGLTDFYGKRSERDYESYFGSNAEMRKVALHFFADHPTCSAAQVFEALREHFGEDELPTLRTVQRFLGKLRP